MKIVALACLILSASVACGAPAQVKTDSVAANDWVRTNTGLAYQIIVKGTGLAARPGQRVRIHETLSLPDGKLIFSTRTADQPVTFTLGANQVIPGVEEGVTSMRVGERRKLLVPPSLDGRTFDPSFIPAGAMRHYDIELMAIVP